MENKKYYLGIDAGTNSIGWCVTDKNYNIIKKQNKHLWGSRLFDEASTAEDRRKNRSSRRRLARRRWRIHLLQDIFKDEINKVDPYFFDKLNNSALHREDLDSPLKDSPMRLFNGNQYTDKQYHAEYKTIYHLRLDLLNNPNKKFDIRLIYLALAHMVKYRGNFLKEGSIKEVGKDTEDLKRLFDELDEAIKAIDSKIDVSDTESLSPYEINKSKAEALLSIFKHHTRIKELLDYEVNSGANPNAPFSKLDKKSLQYSILPAINGGKVDLANLFKNYDSSTMDLVDEKISIEFSDETFVNKTLPTLSTLIGEDKAAVIYKAYEIYNLRILLSILKDADGLSKAFVDIYDNHSDQLSTLKYLLKKYDKKKYNDFFRGFGDEKHPTYAAYIGSNDSNGKVERRKHFKDIDTFYKEIKSILDSFDASKVTEEDKERISKIKESIDAKTYLLRQNSPSNGVLPYQLNENEMRKIIESQGNYYPFLKEKDKDFDDPSKQEYKIISVLKFKIPYYVGPLTKRKEENSSVNRWAVYNDNEASKKITPWNFSDIINKEETEKEFINRLKNTCTYMLGKPTLPKNSILYSLFTVLNEMNNWLIEGALITPEDKEYLLQNLYFKDKSINLQKIKDTLKRKYKRSVSLCSKGSGKEVEKEDIHASMPSYKDMSTIFGTEFFDFIDSHIVIKEQKTFNLVEDIILHVTALEDKKTLISYLEKLELPEKQKTDISKLKYKDWGKLSKDFLYDLKAEVVDPHTDEVYLKSILELLFETSDNLMQIYNSYDFKTQIRLKAEEYIGESSNSIETFIDEQPTAPAVKRTMRQCVKLINELKHILKIDHFESYFVECTRHEAEKKRTATRKKRLQDLYKAAKLSADELNTFSDDRLQSKKIYLYFLQNGKSVYSGESIGLDNLDKYDIDHIIPQAKVKDDSIDNIVLVEKELNNKKQDVYPFVKAGILSEKGKQQVEYLYSKGLMSKAKHDRILRSKELTEQELVGFVNRQLTMTDQSVIGIRNLIDFIEEGESKVIYSKASNVSEFRNIYDFVKVRDLNNLHHANDAYLNIVVGNIYNKVFSSCFNVELLRERFKDYSQTKIDVKNLLSQDQFIPGTCTCVWRAPFGQVGNPDYNEKGSTLEVVRKYMSYQDPLVTHMVRTQPGFMNKISLHSAKENDAMFPIKNVFPYNSKDWKKKYGGYSDLTTPYFILVKSKDKKGKNQYSLENIPTIYEVGMKSIEDRIDYLKNNIGLKEPEIIIPNLLINTVLKIKNPVGYSSVAFTGKSGKGAPRLSVINISEPKLDTSHQIHLKKISKILGTNQPTTKKKDLTKYEKLGHDDDIKEGKITINKEDNIGFFNYLLDVVFEKPCYKYLPGAESAFSSIKAKKTVFVTLSTFSQIRILNEMMKLIGTTKYSSDLTLIGLVANCGKKTISKVLSKGTKIIFNSTTGFYSNDVFTVPED